MKVLLVLAMRSAWNRRSTLSLVAISIALSTLLLLGLERVRSDVRETFSQSVSGTDLIVGARTGSLQLLLYAVFRIGGAANSVQMESLQRIASHPSVEWLVPLSLGDSHRGFPVLATTEDYFTRFRYGARKALSFRAGEPFEGLPRGLYHCVVGAEVAEKLNYKVGRQITLSHGTGAIPADHGDAPFTVVGILEKTGTPVDRTVHISLEGMQAIHVDAIETSPPDGSAPSEAARPVDLTPRRATAALVGLKNRSAVFSVQRTIASYDHEPLMALVPGVALDELWDIVGVGEKALLGVSMMVAVVSVAGLIAVMLAGLNERRRELAVLRAIGASPRHILLMLAAEGSAVTTAGVSAGLAATVMAIAAAGPWIQSHFGVGLTLSPPTMHQYLQLFAVMMVGFMSSLVPGWRAYRLSLADGLSPRSC